MDKQIITDKIKEIIKNKFNIEQEITIESPKDQSHGDYSTNIALQIAKNLGQNPRQVAEQLSEIFKNSDFPEFEKVEIAGPGFINFFISDEFLFSNTIDFDIINLSTYLNSETILIEHTSPNPTKAFHLGHLKNNVTGLAVGNVFAACGANVVKDCIDNNRGIAIAKMMWGYLKFARKSEDTPVDINYWMNNPDEWYTPEDKKLNPGEFMGDFYVLGANDFKEDKDVESIVRQMVIDWENEDEKQWALWKITQDWVWEGYKISISRINGWEFDKIWHEHEIYKRGKEHVERGVKEGFFKKLEDGAVLTDLKKDFDLPDTILLKNDGTSLYITQDLELTYLKKKTFNPTQMFWVIGPEQSLAMKQMFAASSQLGFGKYADFHHLSYGFILVKDENGNPSKMSSRGGVKFLVDDVLDEARDRIKGYITSDLSEEEKGDVAEKVGIAAIKYSLLKVSRTQDLVFNFDETVSLEGDSAPYIMYTYTRAKSILRQQKPNLKLSFPSQYKLNEDEKSILLHIDKFKSTVENAARDYAPSYVCNYIYELAVKFNKFYAHNPVLKAETSDSINVRLAIVDVTAKVLQKCFELIQVEVVERM